MLLIRSGHIKSKDSILAGVLGPTRVSVSVEVDNADRGQRARAGGSRPVEPIGTVQSLV